MPMNIRNSEMLSRFNAERRNGTSVSRAAASFLWFVLVVLISTLSGLYSCLYLFVKRSFLSVLSVDVKTIFAEAGRKRGSNLIRHQPRMALDAAFNLT